MNTFKIILTILLTIIIVIVGFATEILALVDSTVINPYYYKTPLSKLGFYNELRSMLIEEIDKNIDANITVSEEFKTQMYEIVDRSFNKREFSMQLGEFFSGTVGFVLYNNGDGDIPINDWLLSLEKEIVESGIAKKIVDDEILKNNISAEDKEYYYEEYERVIILSISQPISKYSSLIGDSKTFTDVFFKFLAPTEELKASFINDRFFIIQYFIKWAIWSIFIGLGAVLLFIGILFIIWRRKPIVVFKICSISLLVNSIIFILGSIVSFVSINIANSLNLIPSFLLSYLDILKGFVRPFGIITLLFGIILLLIYITLNIIKKRFLLKYEKEDKNNLIDKV